MMKHYLTCFTAILFTCCLFSHTAAAQQQGQRLFTIQTSTGDQSYKCAKTPDSGYLYTNNDTYNNFDGGSAFLSKFDKLHNRQFSIKINDFIITDVTASSDGTYFVSGAVLPYMVDKLLKFSSNGQLIWEKRIQPSSRELGMYAFGYPFKWNSIHMLQNGNILYKKSYPPRTAFIMMDSNGNQLFSREIPILVGDIRETDQQTFIATFFDSPGLYQTTTESGLLLLNNQLNVVRSKRINSNDGIPFFYNIIKATNNNYYVGGVYTSEGRFGNDPAFIVRVDTMLNINSSIKLQAQPAKKCSVTNIMTTYQFDMDQNGIGIVEMQAEERVVYNSTLHATFNVFMLDTLLNPQWSKTIVTSNLPDFEFTQTRATDILLTRNQVIVPFFTYQYPQGYRSQLYYIDAANSDPNCYLPDVNITTGLLQTMSIDRPFNITSSPLLSGPPFDPVSLFFTNATISSICVPKLKPEAAFTINESAETGQEFCLGSTINVNDISSNLAGSFTWTFPPQADLSNADSTCFPAISNIRFSDTGVFNIKLVTCNGNGCDSITKTIRIVPAATPVNMGNDTLLCEDSSLTFIYIPQPGVTHQFLQDGFPVTSSDTLVVNESGVYASIISGPCGVLQDEVVVTIGQRLIADFTFEQPSCSFYTVNFTNTSTPGNNSSLQYQWTFSDSNGVVLGTSTDENPAFTFPSRDMFKVKLIITGPNSFCNQSDSIVQSVTINANARVSFVATPECGNRTVTFNAVVSDANASVLQYQWNFNNEGSSGAERPVFTFAETGEKTVEVTAISPAGCRSIPFQQTINIYPKATVVINNLQDTSMLLNTSMQLTASGATVFNWEPANLLRNHNTASPVFTPTNAGAYTINVEGTTPQGCKGSQRINVMVLNKTPGSLPGVFSPNADPANARFRFNCSGIQSLTYLRIYNLFGKPIYEQRGCNAQGWDGTFHSTPQPMGTYVYNWQGVDLNGKLVSGKGKVMLMR